jgi:hypothetical protein
MFILYNKKLTMQAELLFFYFLFEIQEEVCKSMTIGALVGS